MTVCTLVNKNSGVVISQNLKIAQGFLARLKGLMFRQAMECTEALLFYHAPSIHTFFMFFPIDIVFLDKNMQIMRICKDLKPWRAVFCPGAYMTIELPPNRLSEVFASLGDVLELTSGNSRHKD